MTTPRPTTAGARNPGRSGAVTDEVVERVRRAIYETFASQGHPPSRQHIQDLAAVDEAQVNKAVAELAAQRQLVRDQSGNIVMAHPFPMDEAWNDVVYTCSNQRLFCSERCVQAWLASTGHARGYVMDLTTLWRLASGWYSGRLDSPYQRKDPQGAVDYFRSAGLQGPFWGLRN